MNKIINLSNITKGFLAFVILFVAKHFDSENLLLIPLISLCSCDCSSGAGSGDGSCGCGNGGGGAGGGGSASTPFLCTWNGTDFQFENDILFGKPSSLFATEEAGRSAYEQGSITGDLYKINNSMVPKGDHIAFQIKEVEPEESFIDHLSLLHVTYPKNGELIVHSNFEDFLVFDKASLEKKEGIKSQKTQDQNGADLSEKFAILGKTQDEDSLHVMQTGDVLGITGKVENRNSPLYLLMGSHYRDWTLGDILENGNTSLVKDRIINVISESHSVHAFASGAVKVVGLAILLGAVWIFGSVQSIFSFGNADNGSNATKLASTFGVQSARADVPWYRSLVVEYLDAGVYHEIDVIQPRYYQKTLEAILIPSQAVQESGEVTLRVRATKKHHVTDLALVAPKSLLPFQVTTIGVSKAFHRREKRDYSKILNEKSSKTYLHTIPADVVDIEFGPIAEVPKSEKSEAYLMRAHGFYTPISDESQRIVGDWVPKLDPEAREWLGKMYALKDYNDKDRTTIL